MLRGLYVSTEGVIQITEANNETELHEQKLGSKEVRKETVLFTNGIYLGRRVLVVRPDTYGLNVNNLMTFLTGEVYLGDCIIQGITLADKVIDLPDDIAEAILSISKLSESFQHTERRKIAS